MSRPADTRDTSRASRCRNRLPVEVAEAPLPPKLYPLVLGTSVTVPMSVPEATMSRPAIIQTGPAPSYQVCPRFTPFKTEIVSPLRSPTISPSRA
ncbi:hypothetical protein D3C72_1887060 [compost metagenome]